MLGGIGAEDAEERGRVWCDEGRWLAVAAAWREQRKRRRFLKVTQDSASSDWPARWRRTSPETAQPFSGSSTRPWPRRHRLVGELLRPCPSGQDLASPQHRAQRVDEVSTHLQCILGIWLLCLPVLSLIHGKGAMNVSRGNIPCHVMETWRF